MLQQQQASKTQRSSLRYRLHDVPAVVSSQHACSHGSTLQVQTRCFVKRVPVQGESVLRVSKQSICMHFCDIIIERSWLMLSASDSKP